MPTYRFPDWPFFRILMIFLKMGHHLPEVACELGTFILADHAFELIHLRIAGFITAPTS